LKVRAEFVKSAVRPADYPADGLAELALVGRSNVGKSTLVNALTRQRLARTSAAPGKTRLLNLFRVSPEGRASFYFVDLPGFGYARGGAASAETFERLTRQYFESRAAGVGPGRPPDGFGVLLLVDGRHPGLDTDLRAHDWLAGLGVPLGVVATKIDKLSRAERSRTQHAFDRAFTSPVLPVSAVTGEGMNDLWKLIARLLSSRPPHDRKKAERAKRKSSTSRP
jgi:GTP-binding protein